MVLILVEAPVRPTEDPVAVERAILSMFPDAEVSRGPGWVRGRSESLATLLKKIKEERVSDAARGALWRGRLSDTASRFEINKQAAAVGRVNFNEVTHPLGDLSCTLEIDSLAMLLDRISPPTRAEEMELLRATGATRAELHREEAAIAALGKSIDEPFEDDGGTLDEDELGDLDEAEEDAP